MDREFNTDVLLQVSNLTKSYKDLVAVDNLSFEVKAGEIFGFLGPNGAGKSTTIHMLAGLLKADRGDIRIHGESVSHKNSRAKNLIGLCPQNITVWETLTCLEQLEFVGEMVDVKRREAKKRGLELLDALGLMEKKNQLAKNLSGGMQRRLNIALALVHKPELIILDEPQAGLDPQSRVLVRDYIRSLAKNVTVILTTHEMDEAERLSDRIAIIDQGKLLVVDTPERLIKAQESGEMLEIRLPRELKINPADILNALSSTLTSKTYKDGYITIISNELIDNLPSIIQVLKNFHIPVDELKIRKRTLEDVFIDLTGRGLRE